MSAMATTIAGESVSLLPERALFWTAQSTLFIADPHFGKAATFRARGIFVPRGTTTETLARLDAAIERTGAARIVFLGDFFHARESHSAGTLEALARWRARHPARLISLVRGNHDRHAGDPSPSLGIEIVATGQQLGPFILAHEPVAHLAGHVLAGHLHPVFQLRGRANQTARLPCFWVGDRVSVLPAFGSFTGGAPIATSAGDRVFLVADGRVFAV